MRKAFTILLFLLFVLTCAPLITSVAMGGVFALLFYPWLEALQARRVPTRWGAGLITLLFSSLVLLPLSILIVVTLKTGVEQFKGLQIEWQQSEEGAWAAQILHHPRVQSAGDWLAQFFPVQSSEILSASAEVLKLVAVKVGQGLGQAASKIPGMALSLGVVIVSLYFFLVDSKRLGLFVRRNSFFNPAQTSELMSRLGTTARSVVLASVASGAAQSLVMMVGMGIAGAPNLGMVVFLVFLASFIPLVGSAPVTVSVCLMAFFSGNTNQGIILAISAAIASVIDNIVRPWVLKGGADLHPLVGFVAAFGGLQLLGLSGLFLGPIIAGLFFGVLRLSTRAD